MAKTTHCIYCDKDDIEIIDPDPQNESCEIVPAVDDDEAWAKLAKGHEGWCEWIETRAHQK